jgi:hypothetical protein
MLDGGLTNNVKYNQYQQYYGQVIEGVHDIRSVSCNI